MNDIQKIDWDTLEREICLHQYEVDSVLGKGVVEITYNYIDPWDYEISVTLSDTPRLTFYFNNIEDARTTIKEAFQESAYVELWENIGW